MRQARVQARECGKLAIGVGIALLAAHQRSELGLVVDPASTVRESADDRLHEAGQLERGRLALNDLGETGRCLRHGEVLPFAGDELDLTGEDRLRRWTRETAPGSNEGSDEGRSVLRADHSVGRDTVALLEQSSRIEPYDPSRSSPTKWTR